MIGRDFRRVVLLGLFFLPASRAGSTGADDEEHLPAAAELLLRDGDRVDWYQVRRTPEVCGKVERAKCIELLRKLLRRELSAPTLRLPEGLSCKDPARFRCAAILDGCVPVAGILAYVLLQVAPPAVEATEEMLTAIRRNNQSLTPIAILGLARFKNVAALPYETPLLDSPDLCQALDQLISEALRVARNPADRWRESDDGMHVLAAGFYGHLREDRWEERGGSIERWLGEAVAGGRLDPERLHATAAAILERPTTRLWPVDPDGSLGLIFQVDDPVPEQLGGGK
jgi:hypothetical protein